MSTTFKQNATPVKLGDIVRVTNFAGNPSSDHIGKIVTINRLSKAEGTSYVYYGTEERSPANLERGEFVVLPEVKHEYKQGERVQITIPEGNNDTYGGRYFVTGEGTVLEVDVDGGRTLLQVKADTKHPLRKDGQNDWWVDTKFVTPLVEELPFEVGARVRSKAGYLGGDSEGIVTDLVPHIGGDITIAWDKGRALAGLTLGARRSGLEVIASPVVERPKAIPATETKPQIGDTIVAFWEVGGVETRRKGVIASFDWDGTAVTAEGEYITYDDEEAATDSVFIVERAPKPEPVKVNPFAEAKVGSIATYGESGVKYLKKAEDAWAPISEKGVVAGHRNSDFDMHDNGNVSVTYNA